MRSCFWLLIFSIFCLVACESYPKDPNSTLERAKGAQLMIGAIHAPPWVNAEGEKVTGIEADIAKNFAKTINAEVVWITGTESELFPLLEAFELHMVIGGFTQNSPWKQRIAMTNPYAIENVVVGASPSVPIPVNIKGEEVGVRKNSMMAAYVKQNQGKPILLDSTALREYQGLIVDYESRLKELSVKTATWQLATEKHVLAVPKGENHFLVTLEKYLNEIGY